jgi:hypothetical protein
MRTPIWCVCVMAASTAFGLDFNAPIEKLVVGFKFAEGPVWVAAKGELLFSDIPANRIVRFKDGKDETFRTPSNNANGLTLDKQGRLVCWSVAALLAGATAGCGPSYPKCIGVTGQVTYRGKSVGSGIVSFTRLGPTGGKLDRPAAGDLHADGSYTMRTFRSGEGVLPGEYAVTIVAFDYASKRDQFQRLPSLIPTKYGSPQTSGLKATVPPDAAGPIRFDFDLAD